MTDRKRYSQKYKDDAVELVISSGRPIAQVAPDIGRERGHSGDWVRKYREDHLIGSSPRRRQPCLGTITRKRWRRTRS